MQKNTFKKITALIYLTIFLFGLFVPFSQSFAQTKDLVISIDKIPDSQTGKIILKTGENVKITVTSNKTKGGEIVSFFSSPSGIGEAFTPGTAICKMPASTMVQTCFINFNSLTEATFSLFTSVNVGDSIYKSNTINDVMVKKEIVTPPLLLPPNCVAPQRLNDDKTACITDTNTTYTPLAPLPGLPAEPYDTSRQCATTKNANGTETTTCANPCPFGNYLNIIIKLIIGIAAVLAMVMIVMGGIQYMTSDLISSKEAGKEQITHAVLGLLLALGAFIILNTINPKLLSACLDKLPQATIIILPYDANINSYIVKTSGNCKPVASDDCSVQNLTNIFGSKATNASMICNVESSGVASSISQSDKCSSSQTTFSFGLFQINLLIHGDKIPGSVGNCKDLFTRDDGSSITKGYAEKDGSGKITYNCKLRPERGDDYNKCSAYLKTAAGNLFVTSQLFKSRVFKDWEPSDKKVCPAAFQ